MSNPSLRRELNLWGATAFVVTSMVGTGIFTVPALVRVATPEGMTSLSLWLMGAMLALCGALCYAELATRMPQAGGEYQYLTRVFGPMWGFVSGWITFFVGFAAPIAASALGAIAYIQSAFPAWNPNTPLMGTSLTEGGFIAALLPWGLAAWHSLGVRSSGRLQSLLMILVLGAIALLIGAGCFTGRGDWNRLIEVTPPTASFWIALLQVSYAYTGWNGAAYLAGEISDPRRNLPRALVGGTMIVVAVYLALNVLFLYAVPINEWPNNVAIGHTAAEHLFGSKGARFVSLIIAFTILGSLSAWTAAGARVYYAMALDDLAPSAFKLLSKRSNAPIVALYVQAFVASVLALTGQFSIILTYVGAGLSLFSAFTIFALFVLRYRNATDETGHFQTPFFPIPALIFLALVGYSCVQSFREAPKPTSAALLTLLTGFLFFGVGRAFGWFKPQAS